MSDLSNDPSSPEQDLNVNDAPRGNMLVTILLIICALVLASLMMFYYGIKMSGTDGDMENFSLDLLKEKGMAATQQFAASEEGNPADALAVQMENLDDKFDQMLQSRDEKVRWPKLKLTGFGSSHDGNGGFAIINGKQIHPGQTSKEQVKLIEVRSHDVIVEYMGEQRRLTVDIKN